MNGNAALAGALREFRFTHTVVKPCNRVICSLYFHDRGGGEADRLCVIPQVCVGLVVPTSRSLQPDRDMMSEYGKAPPISINSPRETIIPF